MLPIIGRKGVIIGDSINYWHYWGQSPINNSKLGTVPNLNRKMSKEGGQ